MEGPTYCGTIKLVRAGAMLTVAQLYIEYYLNEGNFAMASEFADDALSLLSEGE
jgi:hypothetical protein